MNPVVIVKELEKIFLPNRTVALKKISFSIFKGDVVGLIGNNGAGKTTTINLILGLIDKTFGSIEIYLEKAKKTIWDSMSYLPENNIFPTHLTGFEYCYLMYGFRYNKPIKKKVLAEMLSEQALIKKELLANRISTYSKGNKRMLGIAEALLCVPAEFIVLDEPFEGLDPYNQELLERTIRMYNEKGVTFFISTHSIEKVKTMCNRVIFLKKGEIVLDSEIEKISKNVDELRKLYEEPL